jgi:hypothetical protein
VKATSVALASKTLMATEFCLLGEPTTENGRSSIWGDNYLTPHAAYPRLEPDTRNLLFGLAPSGVCLAAMLPIRRCALTAPFHPYR